MGRQEHQPCVILEKISREALQLTKHRVRLEYAVKTARDKNVSEYDIQKALTGANVELGH